MGYIYPISPVELNTRKMSYAVVKTQENKH